MNNNYYNNDYYQDLITALREKKSELQEFTRLTSLQRSAVVNEKMDELAILIQDKQLIINKIDNINEKIRKLESSLESNFLSYDIDYQDLKKQIYDQLIHARELDEEVRMSFGVMADRMVKAIKELRLGRRTVKGYFKKSAQAQGYFVDKKK